MNILIHLASHPGKVVTNEELLEQHWKGRVVANDAVHRRIADLRKKLGDDKRQPTYIETVHKKGYRLIAKVQRADELAAKHRSSAGEVVIAIDSYGREDERTSSRLLQEEISGLLLKVGWIRVLPGNVLDNSRYRLRVGTKIIGSRLRLTCQLADNATESEISMFSREYESESIFFAKSPAICSGVISVVIGEILTAERHRVVSIPIDQATSWELCMKCGDDDLDTAIGQEKTEKLLIRALDRDPSHAHAHARLAYLFAYSATAGRKSPAELLDRARFHLDQALAMERRDPFVINDCVMTLAHLGEIERASELGDALHRYFPVWEWSHMSTLLLERSEYAEALQRLEEHTTYHPEPLPVKSRESIIILLLNSRFKEARQIALRAAVFRNHSFVDWAIYANVLGHLDRSTEAVGAWSRAKELARGLSIERWHQRWSNQFHNPEVSEVLTNGLKKVGVE